MFADQGCSVRWDGGAISPINFPVTPANCFFRQTTSWVENWPNVAWNGPIEELTKTSNCQPALFVHGLACLATVRELAGDFAVAGAAGLSLGEMTAHAAAGTFDFASGLRLVQTRGGVDG